MSETIIPLLFGWPAIIISLLISIAGLVLRKPWLLVLGGVLAAPFSWYLSGNPGIGGPAILLPLFQFGAGWALQRGKKALAWVLLAPLAIVMLFLAVIVLRQ